MSLLSNRLDGTSKPTPPAALSPEDLPVFPIAVLRSVDEILAEADLDDDPALEAALREIRSNRSQRVYEERETKKAKSKKARVKKKAKTKAKSKSKPKTSSGLSPEEELLKKIFGD